MEPLYREGRIPDRIHVSQDGIEAPRSITEAVHPSRRTSMPVPDSATNDFQWTLFKGAETVKEGPCHISTGFVETVKLLRIGQDIMNSL